MKEPTTEVIELFRDWLPYVNESAKYGHSNCSGKVGLADWNCCETHRRLRAQSVDLDKRASEIGISHNATYSILSPLWWHENGIPYNHSDEHEPLEYFGFHSREWDRLSRLAAYAKSLLQPELESLKGLRDAETPTERLRVINERRGWSHKYHDVAARNDLGTCDVVISAAGLARIAEIEGLLK